MSVFTTSPIAVRDDSAAPRGTARPRRATRAAIVVAALGAAATLAGCASVAGTGSTDPTEVAAYESTLASSRTAAAQAAAKSACTSWTANMNVRLTATQATTAFTKDPKWDWDGIASLVNAELAALATESGKLPAIITTAEPDSNLHGLLADYKTKLDAYTVALRTDFTARGTESNTWPKRNPAAKTLGDATTVLENTCPSS